MLRCARLNSEEVKKFCTDFYELEVSRDTIVTISPDNSHTKYNVTLQAEKFGAELLEASFNDGLLRQCGWSEKFTLI